MQSISILPNFNDLFVFLFKKKNKKILNIQNENNYLQISIFNQFQSHIHILNNLKKTTIHHQTDFLHSYN